VPTASLADSRSPAPGTALDFSTAVKLFDSPYVHRPNVALAYDVTSDGRFLMMKRANTATAPPAIDVAVNWKPGQAR